jgi:hypothetical protein
VAAAPLASVRSERLARKTRARVCGCEGAPALKAARACLRADCPVWPREKQEPTKQTRPPPPLMIPPSCVHAWPPLTFCLCLHATINRAWQLQLAGPHRPLCSAVRARAAAPAASLYYLHQQWRTPGCSRGCHSFAPRTPAPCALDHGRGEVRQGVPLPCGTAGRLPQGPFLAERRDAAAPQVLEPPTQRFRGRSPPGRLPDLPRGKKETTRLPSAFLYALKHQLKDPHQVRRGHALQGPAVPRSCREGAAAAPRPPLQRGQQP